MNLISTLSVVCLHGCIFMALKTKARYLLSFQQNRTMLNAATIRFRVRANNTLCGTKTFISSIEKIASFRF